MIYQILNGDALAENFDLEGEIVVCREALVEGELRAKDLNEFWSVRAGYFKEYYGADDYFLKVKSEFEKLDNLKATDEVNLWFGDEVFCVVNMSFVLWLLGDKQSTFYRVYPDSNDWNCSYQNVNKCFESRQKLTENDLRNGKMLWMAFQANEFDSINPENTGEFPALVRFDEVFQAIREIETQPREILREIRSTGETNFSKIFAQFKQKAGVYGFGDNQVRNTLDEP